MSKYVDKTYAFMYKRINWMSWRWRMCWEGFVFKFSIDYFGFRESVCPRIRMDERFSGVSYGRELFVAIGS